MEKDTFPNSARQGDVYVKRVNKKLNNKIDNKQKETILAYGEVTGHKHAFYTKDVIMVSMDKQTLVNIAKVSKLKHEEHKDIEFNPGVYKVVKQLQYSQKKVMKAYD